MMCRCVRPALIEHAERAVPVALRDQGTPGSSEHEELYVSVGSYGITKGVDHDEPING